MTDACSRWMAVCVDMFDHPVVGMASMPPPAADKARHAQQPMIAWQDMLRSAAYAEKTINHKNASIILKRGEFLAGRAYWAKRWNWGEQAVRNFFARLIANGMIAISNQSLGHVANVATICNYDIYQSRKPNSKPDEKPVPNQCPTSAQPEGNQTLQGTTILNDDTREETKTDQQVEALQQVAGVMRGEMPAYGTEYVDAANVNGKPVLTPKARVFWLERFGGDAIRLEAAILEATPEFPAKSAMAFSNGVVRRLGQIAGKRMDMAANYDRAVKNGSKGRKPAFGEEGHDHKVSSETKRHVRPAGYDFPEAGRGA